MNDVRRGLIIVNTGPGKGKTTAAMGTGLRAVGNGLRVLMLQFLKGSWHYGELDAVKAFGDKFVMKQMGRGFVKVGGAETDPEDVRMVEEAWSEAEKAIAGGEWDLVILDEINYAISLRHARSRESGYCTKGKAGNGSRDLDRAQCTSDNRRGCRHGHRNARSQARVPEGHHGAARHRVLRFLATAN